MPKRKKRTQKKQEYAIQRFFASRLFLIVGLIILAFVAFGYARAYYRDYEIRQEIKSLEEEVRRLERKKLESLDILDYVMSDAFVEEKARTELNMRKDGEQMLIVQSDDIDVATTRREQEERRQTRQAIKNPVKWWYYFTHRSLDDVGNEEIQE